MKRKGKVQAIAVVAPKAPEVMAPATSILHQAVQSGASVEVLERLLRLQEQWEASQARKAFERAMAQAREHLPTIIKSSVVDFTSSKGRTHYRYEDLPAVTAAVAPVLARHGLTFRWRTKSTDPGAVMVTCIVSHADGHSEETTLGCGLDHSGNKNDIQAIGSAVTYLQRYTLKAALGVAAALDDDGQRVKARETTSKKAAQAEPRPPTATGTIDEAQAKRLWSIARRRGRTEEEMSAYIRGLGYKNTREIEKEVYSGICAEVEAAGSLPAGVDR